VAQNTIVSSGTTLSHKDVVDTKTITILKGGTGEDLSAGATAPGGTIYDSGKDIDASIYAGGVEDVMSGGRSRGTEVMSGGSEAVSSGGLSKKAVISSGGVETVYGDGTSIKTHIDAGGTEIVAGGGTATSTTIAGGTLVLDGGSVTSGGISFTGTGGTLQIATPSAMPTTTIENFKAGDSIDLSFVKYDAGDTYSVKNDTLTISAGGQKYVLSINDATPGAFELTAGANGELVVAVCYYPGTMIRTPEGDMAVESLAIGDAVITADGRAMPIRWIGRNTVSTRFADPLRVLPIRIRAGALDDNLPERDLLVSPEHALMIDDVLVQAGALVNGVSILRERDVPEIFVYYHVELAEHALILAEGTPAESFVDNVHRMAFDNWEEHEALYGRSPVAEMPHPRAQSYRQVPEDIQDRLLARAYVMEGAALKQTA
jgi:autotransporter passenger strand-loop-strand repeat protein